MRLRSFLLITVIVFAGLGYIAYALRFQIEAKIWHWKHGGTTGVGNYEIPVPDHWLIYIQDLYGLTMMNTNPIRPSDGRFHTSASITIFARRNQSIGTGGLDSWLAWKRQSLQRKNVSPVEEKELGFGDETLVCIGGNEIQTILGDAANSIQTNIISLECRSDKDLTILFAGEPSDLQFFYNLVSQIHLHN
jgi:hypothetical protein